MSIARTTLYVAALPLVFSSVCLGADAAGPEILPSGLASEEVENRTYLDYARECIELLLRHGTDRYGEVHSPLLMNILDVRTRTCPEDPLALDEAFRVTRRGRRGPAGGNPHEIRVQEIIWPELWSVNPEAVTREIEAVSKLYYQGLFRGHPAKPYYESVDGVGYLLYALVQLDQSLKGPGDGNVSMLNW